MCVMVQDKATGQMYILMEARLQELFKKPADDCTILAKMKAGLSAGKVMQYLLIDAIYYRTFLFLFLIWPLIKLSLSNGITEQMVLISHWVFKIVPVQWDYRTFGSYFSFGF